MIDVDAFVNQTTEDATSSEYLNPDEGEYQCMIGDGPVQKWIQTPEFTDKKTGQKRTMTTLEIPVEIIDDAVRQSMGRERVFSRFRIILDLDNNGNIDFNAKGKNVKLGQLREALDQNTPGKQWTLGSLPNAGPFKGTIKQNPASDGSGRVYAEISRVARS